MYGIGKKHHRDVMDELRTVFTFYTVGPFQFAISPQRALGTQHGNRQKRDSFNARRLNKKHEFVRTFFPGPVRRGIKLIEKLLICKLRRARSHA